MIDALIAGKLTGKPAQRTGSSGKPFVTAKVRVATEMGAIFVSVITFSPATGAALLALDDGDSVALTGSLKPKVYQPKDGSEARASLDMVAHAALTAYHVTRKRQAVSREA
jgi:RPA family protein